MSKKDTNGSEIPKVEVLVETDGTVEIIEKKSDAKLKRVENEAMESLKNSYNILAELSDLRLDCKLSNSRVAGVAREVKELIKVMSVFLC